MSFADRNIKMSFHIVEDLLTKLIILYQLKCVANNEDIKKGGDNLMAHYEGKCPLLLPSCLVFVTFHSYQRSSSNDCMLMVV
jgi:hypothetical protein